MDSEIDDYYNDRIKNKKTNPKVYDISHKYLPDISKFIFLSDYFVYLYFIPFFLYMKKDMAMDFIMYFLIVFIIRDVIMLTTVLPKDKNCKLHNSKLKYFYHGSCYDKILSGHFSTVMILSFLYYKYNIVKNVNILVVLNILNALIILSTRSHYFIDIILAFFVTAVVIYKFNETKIRCDKL